MSGVSWKDSRLIPPLKSAPNMPSKYTLLDLSATVLNELLFGGGVGGGACYEMD